LRLTRERISIRDISHQEPIGTATSSVRREAFAVFRSRDTTAQSTANMPLICKKVRVLAERRLRARPHDGQPHEVIALAATGIPARPTARARSSYRGAGSAGDHALPARQSAAQQQTRQVLARAGTGRADLRPLLRRVTGSVSAADVTVGWTPIPTSPKLDSDRRKQTPSRK
jgi:hypothetical protein